MRTKIKIPIKIIEGRISYDFEYKKKLRDFLQEKDNSDGILIIDFDKKRTDLQNSFFHGPIVNMAMRMCQKQNHPKAFDREFIKEVILKKPFLTVGYGDESYVRSTSDLSKKEFIEFINNCLKLFAHFGEQLTPQERVEYDIIINNHNLGPAIDQALAL